MSVFRLHHRLAWRGFLLYLRFERLSEQSDTELALRKGQTTIRTKGVSREGFLIDLKKIRHTSGERVYSRKYGRYFRCMLSGNDSILPTIWAPCSYSCSSSFSP